MAMVKSFNKNIHKMSLQNKRFDMNPTENKPWLICRIVKRQDDFVASESNFPRGLQFGPNSDGRRNDIRDTPH